MRGSSGVLEGLCPAGRKLHESIPDEIRYVPHPDFRVRRTEQDLFGPEAEDVPVLGWQQFSIDNDDAAPPPKARSQLTRQEERTLFMRYNYAKYRLAGLLTEQRRRPSAARVRGVLLWYSRVLEHRAALARANMALVVAMGKQARLNSVEFAGLVSEGNMALLRVIDRFDVTRGFKFSTYACSAILKSFSRLASKTSRYRQRYPVQFDSDMQRTDEAERRHAHQRDLAIEDLRRVLVSNIGGLTDVERTIVGARFAVGGYRHVHALEQVGRMVGLSKERVRQIQKKALDKLRVVLEEAAA